MMSFNYQIVLILCQIFKIMQHISQEKETLTTVSPIYVYINRINKRLVSKIEDGYEFNRINNILVFKIKDGYKLELQTPETLRLFGSTKKLIDKTENRENVPSLEAVEIVLAQYSLEYNEYQQKSEVIYSFICQINVMVIC